MEASPATYVHEAPPRRAPISALAIVAFVLSILFVCGALAGVWWLQLLPLLLAVIAWPAISAGRRRGGGFAIAASLIALVSAVGLYFNLRQAMRQFEEDVAGRFLNALEDRAQNRGDDSRLKEYVLLGEEPEPTIARWKANYAKAREAYGPFTGGVSTRWGMWGPMISLVYPTPDGIEEVGNPEGALPQGPTIWVKATFEKETLWVAAEILKEGKTDQKTMREIQDEMQKGSMKAIREVRFFRAKD